jgi:hypothetical protein
MEIYFSLFSNPSSLYPEDMLTSLWDSYVRQHEYVLTDCKLIEKWSLLCLLLAGTQRDWSIVPLKIVVLTVLVVSSYRLISSEA